MLKLPMPNRTVGPTRLLQEREFFKADFQQLEVLNSQAGYW
jgi:hypothetical protein